MIGFLKPAKPIAQMSDEKMRKKYPSYRIRAFIMIMVAYMAYYLVRKNFTIASPLLVHNLHFTKVDIGFISSVFAISYGISKFLLGTLADRSNVKNYLLTGLAASAVLNLLMVFSTKVWMFAILMLLNGIFQAMGAPACHITIGRWFNKTERGLRMGIWNTSHNLGGGLVGPMGTLAVFLFGSTHKGIFFLPAAICIALAVFLFFIGVDTPASKGLPKVSEYKPEPNDVLELEEVVAGEDIEASSMSIKEIIFKYVLTNKYIWILAITNIFIYVVRQGTIDWIPLYLTQSKHFTDVDANWAMMLFEYAAIPATILIGWLSDVVFKGNRAPLGIICMFVVLVALIIYWKADSYLVTMIAVALIGCGIYGPAMLINMSLIDLVPHFVIGAADGFAGLTAYVIGELNADLVIGFIAEKYGWGGSFKFMIFGAVCALLGLVILQVAVSRSKKATAKM